MELNILLFNKLLDFSEDLTRFTDPNEASEAKKALESPEYLEYKAYRLYSWGTTADLHLINRLYKLEVILNTMPPEQKNYPALLREYSSLIKLTSPLLSQLQKTRLQHELSTQLNSLEIEIK